MTARAPAVSALALAVTLALAIALALPSSATPQADDAETLALSKTLLACLDAAAETLDDPRRCIGAGPAVCAEAGDPAACLDREAAAWDHLSVALSGALAPPDQPVDEGLVAEARADVLSHRAALCADAGVARAVARCGRDKAAERAIVFHMLRQLSGDAQ